MLDTIRSIGVRACAVAALAIMTVSCGTAVRWEQPAPPRSSGPTDGIESGRAERGNPPFYEVFGRRYHVLETSSGFRERGVASWYGRKFHGNSTSSGEIYDMHAMTAAHKTLPLPTWVRVRNLTNGRTIVVKVNDRGPFVDNRVIDLSYAAAHSIGMVGTGTTLVEIVALPGDPTLRRPQAAKAQPVVAGDEALSMPSPAGQRPVSVYLQVGAFGDAGNARQMLEQLRGRGIRNVFIRADTKRQPALYRVRLGPISGVEEYDALVAKMAALQIHDTHLVTETAGATGT